jgi:hypothetical protein
LEFTDNSAALDFVVLVTVDVNFDAFTLLEEVVGFEATLDWVVEKDEKSNGSSIKDFWVAISLLFDDVVDDEVVIFVVVFVGAVVEVEKEASEKKSVDTFFEETFVVLFWSKVVDVGVEDDEVEVGVGFDVAGKFW